MIVFTSLAVESSIIETVRWNAQRSKSPNVHGSTLFIELTCRSYYVNKLEDVK